MSETLPIWVEYARALAVPAIAFAGVCIAGANLWLGYRKRKDDLFDKRYAFFKLVCSSWAGAVEKEPETGESIPDWDTRAAYANESLFLFGPDIAEHLNHYTEPFDHRFSHLPNQSFVKPFDKYLRLGKSGNPDYG